ncbi:unnamed protein product, partial [Phaeothamnion confervicola]
MVATSGGFSLSSDANQWTFYARPDSLASQGAIFDGVCYGLNQYVATWEVRSANTLYSTTSPDGKNWSVHPISLPPDRFPSLSGVASDNVEYKAVGHYSTSTVTTYSDLFLSSPDGINWSTEVA